MGGGVPPPRVHTVVGVGFLWIAVAVVAVGYVMARRLAGEPAQVKRLVVLP